MAEKRKLDRLLRVRTLQLGLVRAEEAAANSRVAQEMALRERIDQLAANVAPVAATVEGTATGFIAAAHYRERLAQSAFVAAQRVQQAERGHAAAREATREAKRDQDAIEKLLVRAEKEAVLKALRAMEELPPVRKNRHDPC